MGFTSGSVLQRMVWSIFGMVAPTTSCDIEWGLRGWKISLGVKHKKKKKDKEIYNYT